MRCIPGNQSSSRGVPWLTFFCPAFLGKRRVGEAYHSLPFYFLYPGKPAELVRRVVACFPYAQYLWEPAEFARHIKTGLLLGAVSLGASRVREAHQGQFSFVLHLRKRAEFARRIKVSFPCALYLWEPAEFARHIKTGLLPGTVPQRTCRVGGVYHSLLSFVLHF